MDLSINICTYNNKEFLKTCLLSIYNKLHNIRFEVLVVDNGSKDGTVEMIKADFPDIILIENTSNNGVARARNQSIHYSTGRYILLLDADTEFVEGEFKAILVYMDSSPNIGLIGVRQITFDNQPYPAARTFPRVKHILLRRLAFLPSVRASQTFKNHHLLLSNLQTPMEVDYVIGAFQLVRAELLNSVGFLDEKMFYGFEDADYCARVKKAGYQVIYYPFFTIKHYVQGMTRKNFFTNPMALVLLLHHCKSYIRLYIKHRDLFRGERK